MNLKDRRRIFHRRLFNWHKRSYRDFPWRHSDSVYDILVAEILLQKTNANNVVPVYRKLIEQYPNAEALVRAKRSTLVRITRTLGLIKRVDTLKRMAVYLTEEDEGLITLNKLLAIKGVGQYMARATLIHSKSARLPLLDPNFIRIYDRVFLVTSEKSRPREDVVLLTRIGELMPKRNTSRFVYAVLDFGALVCKSRNPLCSECPMYSVVCAGV